MNDEEPLCELDQLFYKGEDLVNDEMYEKAIPYLNKVVKKCNEYLEDALLYKGLCYLNKDKPNYNKAKECFDNVVGINPKALDVWSFKANISYRLGDYEDALKFLTKNIEADPTALDAWHQKACLLFELERWKELIEICDETIDRFPTPNEKEERKQWLSYDNGIFGFPWEFKSKALMELRKFDDVIRVTEEALMINYKWQNIWKTRIESLIWDNAYKRALKECKRAIATCSDKDFFLVLRDQILNVLDDEKS